MKKDLTIEELDSIKQDIGYQMLTNLEGKIKKVSEERKNKGKVSNVEVKMVKMTSQDIKDLKAQITSSQLESSSGDIGKQFSKFV